MLDATPIPDAPLIASPPTPTHPISRSFCIDPIEKRAGDSLAIPVDLGRPAAAVALEIAEVTARTWIHGGDEHELGRECDAAGRARDRDFAVFERMTVSPLTSTRTLAVASQTLSEASFVERQMT